MRRKRVKAKLRLHPDPILTQVCEPVEDGEDVSGIIRDMMHILTNSNHGVGLAAPQAGHLKRIILVGQSAMINPVITYLSQKSILEPEGCLSYPGKQVNILRSEEIKVEYTNFDGIQRGYTVSGFQARIIQHEIDHLDGKCRVGELK